ncbi:hypothetical protein TCAL_08469 [Tigriopus californicus]|uniref:Uncharacterized protein n=1 Tax=Tigriopus californicus TaxID=6832 RepID=A0A553N6G7_TIGCA|nr:hypothetical protein TCAL_08469 [Tigriopus californicus]|eukprot:TCALIF_08469-PA protein Name:"Similar to Btrc F-box/WD repeat-containing protein 1A (Mus musculus)" AED:0.09 eAED:0.09 QI:438/0.33/0.25/0.75/1/1/4/548/580
MASPDGPCVAVIPPLDHPPVVGGAAEEEVARAVLASEEEEEEDDDSEEVGHGLATGQAAARSDDEDHEDEEADGQDEAVPHQFERASPGHNCDNCLHARRFAYPQPRLKSSLLRSMRRTGLHFSPTHPGRRSPAPSTTVVDILTLIIQWQMYHLSDQILSYLDAVSLRTCEEVCCLWRGYIRHQKTWRKVVVNTAKETPQLMELNGWNRLLSRLSTTRDMVDMDVFKNLYWKMTTLKEVWRHQALSENKNHFKRSGTIVWTFLPSGRSVSVYTQGKGYVIKIHDDMTFKFRALLRSTLGTVKKDNLCLDATEKRIAVGGFVSQKVWVFNVKEGPITRKRHLEYLLGVMKGELARAEPTLDIELYKFINAESGVRKIKLHPDEKRMAVLLPSNQSVEIWDIDQVIRLQTHSVQADSLYLIWKEGILVTAPTYSGIIQVFNTDRETRVGTVVGNLRRIDAIAMYNQLIVTAEGKMIKLWSMPDEKMLIHWIATKGHLCSLFLNDVIVVSGSSAGVVKIWDLKTLFLLKGVDCVPIRRITMKGILHYPIKFIHLWSYTNMVIVAKYEAKKRKDKVKIVQVKTY